MDNHRGNFEWMWKHLKGKYGLSYRNNKENLKLKDIMHRIETECVTCPFKEGSCNAEARQKDNICI